MVEYYKEDGPYFLVVNIVVFSFLIYENISD